MFIKRKFHFVFILGLIWELFEYFVSQNETTKELLIKYWPVPQRIWEERNIMNKVMDMTLNMSDIIWEIFFLYTNKINLKTR